MLNQREKTLILTKELSVQLITHRPHKSRSCFEISNKILSALWNQLVISKTQKIFRLSLRLKGNLFWLGFYFIFCCRTAAPRKRSGLRCPPYFSTYSSRCVRAGRTYKNDHNFDSCLAWGCSGSRSHACSLALLATYNAEKCSRKLIQSPHENAQTSG